MANGHAVGFVQPDSRQLKVVKLYVYIAWLYLAIFLPIFVFLIRNIWITLVMCIDAVLLAGVQLSFTARPKLERITFVLSSIAALTVGALVITGGIQQTGLLIAFPYVPFIAFIRSRKSAQRWLFGMLLYMVGLLILAMAKIIVIPYEQTNFSIAILMYIFTLLLTFAYVREKTVVDNQVLEDAKALVRVNRKLSEMAEAQKQATARADAMLRSIGEGVIAFDAEGKVRASNKVAERLLGFKEDQLVHGNYTELVKATDEDGTAIKPEERPVNRVIATKKAVATRLYYTRKNGNAFPAQITVAPIILDGTFLGAIEVFRDIYMEKQIDKSKTEFVSLASHQLRTPLSTISWYAEMLLAGDAGKITEEQTRYVDEIYQSNRRMAELVGALLNVSRIELGTFSVDPEPTDLVKLAQGTVKDLEPQIFARKINFQEKYASDIPIINADPKLLRIVIENLASNAIKYTPEAGTVTLYLKRQAGHIQIIVEDNGLGIPTGQQDKIFSKLFRADNVKAHDTEGTGLGLYLVKSIVDYSGGKIWFKSKENKGTTFSVSLPDSGMKHKQGTKELG
jgi:PAS domain S-box-containing protein